MRTSRIRSLWERIAITLEMIKFPHTVFALPFAFSSAFLAAWGFPPWEKILWIGVAMAGARSGAMALNRLIDADLDAQNPRTQARALPQGLVSKAFVVGFAVVSLAALIFAAWKLNRLCLELSPIALAVLVGYSYVKRFSWGTHLALGVALGLAPLGAWAGIRGEIAFPAWLLAGGVLCWVAGFDVLYALQDEEHDRAFDVHSIPRLLGRRGSLAVAKALHVVTLALLAGVALVLLLGLIYWLGLAAVGSLLAYEHSLLSPQDISRLGVAFFTVNGYISITFFLATALAVLA